MTAVWDVPHLAAGSQKPDLDPEQVYLYNMRFCPYAERALLVALAKNIDFKVININLKQKPEWFVEETFGKVPVMLYKDDIIPESLIVSDLIDEMYPGQELQPKDAMQKARDKVLLEMFSRVVTCYYKIMFAKEQEAKSAAIQDCSDNLKKVTDDLKKRGTKYFCGEQPGMLDYMMWPWIERMPCLEMMEVNLPGLDQLKDYVQAMWQTEAVKKYGLKGEVHFQFIKQYMDQKEHIDYDFLLKK